MGNEVNGGLVRIGNIVLGRALERAYGRLMMRNLVLLGLGWAIAGGVQAQIAVFPIPRVEAHTLGLNAVTRPTLMAGSMFGMGGQGLGGGGPGMGQSVNPNLMAARMMLLPETVPGVGGAGGPATAALVSPTGQVLPMDAKGMIATAASTPATVGRPRPVSAARAASVEKKEPAEVKDARLLAHQQEQARSGSPSAQWALAQRYERGEGVEASVELAEAWKSAALRSGYQP